jgi:hypothetical protein
MKAQWGGGLVIEVACESANWLLVTHPISHASLSLTHSHMRTHKNTHTHTLSLSLSLVLISQQHTCKSGCFLIFSTWAITPRRGKQSAQVGYLLQNWRHFGVHAEPSHWLHKISISKTVDHHFWPRLQPPLPTKTNWGVIIY